MDKQKELYEIFTRIWRFMKKYSSGDFNKDEFWEDITEAVDKEVKATETKYQELITSILLIILEYFEKERKENKRNEANNK